MILATGGWLGGGGVATAGRRSSVQNVPLSEAVFDTDTRPPWFPTPTTAPESDNNDVTRPEPDPLVDDRATSPAGTDNDATEPDLRDQNDTRQAPDTDPTTVGVTCWVVNDGCVADARATNGDAVSTPRYAATVSTPFWSAEVTRTVEPASLADATFDHSVVWRSESTERVTCTQPAPGPVTGEVGDPLENHANSTSFATTADGTVADHAVAFALGDAAEATKLTGAVGSGAGATATLVVAVSVAPSSSVTVNVTANVPDPPKSWATGVPLTSGDAVAEVPRPADDLTVGIDRIERHRRCTRFRRTSA